MVVMPTCPAVTHVSTCKAKRQLQKQVKVRLQGLRLHVRQGSVFLEDKPKFSPKLPRRT